MKLRRSIYSRPAFIRGQQCAEAPAGRRRTTAANDRGGGQTRPWRRGCPRRPCGCAVRGLLVQTASARRSVQPLSRGRAWSPWSTRPAGTPRRRSPVSTHAVSTHPVLASGIRLSGRPVSGHLGSSSRASGGRTAAVHPSRVQPSAVHPCGVQPSAVCPRRSGRVRLLPLRRWRGDQVEVAGRPWPPEPVEAPVAAEPSTARSTVAEARTRARLPTSRWSVGVRWRTRAAGLGAGRGSRRVAAVIGLGARPRWVVVAEPDGRVGGPGGARGGAGGDGRAAPARPKPTASVPGSLPAAL